MFDRIFPVAMLACLICIAAAAAWQMAEGVAPAVEAGYAFIIAVTVPLIVLLAIVVAQARGRS